MVIDLNQQAFYCLSYCRLDGASPGSVRTRVKIGPELIVMKDGSLRSS